MERVHIHLPASLLAEVDCLRGDVPRAAWLRRAVEQRVEKDRLAQYTGMLAAAQGDETLYRYGADPLTEAQP